MAKNAALLELYGLAEEAFKGGQDKIQLEAFPFQMTAENAVRHADDPNAPFWDMLGKPVLKARYSCDHGFICARVMS